MHLRALRREQVRDRVADRDPAPAARVQRSGRVRRDELEVDPPAREHVRGAVPVARRDDRRAARRAATSGARKRLTKPGSATSTRARWGTAAASSAASISLGDLERVAAAPPSWRAAMATGVAQSPWSRCSGGSSDDAGRAARAVRRSASAAANGVRRSSRIMWGAAKRTSRVRESHLSTLHTRRARRLCSSCTRGQSTDGGPWFHGGSGVPQQSGLVAMCQGGVRAAAGGSARLAALLPGTLTGVATTTFRARQGGAAA